MSRREMAIFGLALVAAVVVPGLASAIIHSQGYGTLGSFTWMVGYGTGVVAIWYVWLRPLNLTGPAGGTAREADE